jgi:hypothetical protein
MHGDSPGPGGVWTNGLGAWNTEHDWTGINTLLVYNPFANPVFALRLDKLGFSCAFGEAGPRHPGAARQAYSAAIARIGGSLARTSRS